MLEVVVVIKESAKTSKNKGWVKAKVVRRGMGV